MNSTVVMDGENIFIFVFEILELNIFSSLEESPCHSIILIHQGGGGGDIDIHKEEMLDKDITHLQCDAKSIFFNRI